MSLDLLAGAAHRPVAVGRSQAVVLTFDSGLGGLTVLAELQRLLPQARHVYLADDAAFPYGDLPERDLIDRVLQVVGRAVETYRPHLVVIACNTASTLMLAELRARHPVPFVGTVPAIKLAADTSRARAFAVLSPPGTAARDYTRRLVETYARDCAVTLVGSPRLAELAQAHLRGEAVPDESVAAEIAPCFVDAAVDTVVLACTHYPLLRPQLERLQPRPVAWLDPAPAIARRALALLPGAGRSPPAAPHRAVFTGGADLTPALITALKARGLGQILVEPMPFSRRQALTVRGAVAR